MGSIAYKIMQIGAIFNTVNNHAFTVLTSLNYEVKPLGFYKATFFKSLIFDVRWCFVSLLLNWPWIIFTGNGLHNKVTHSSVRKKNMPYAILSPNTMFNIQTLGWDLLPMQMAWTGLKQTEKWIVQYSYIDHHFGIYLFNMLFRNFKGICLKWVYAQYIMLLIHYHIKL